MSVTLNDPRTIHGWAMYDWANSAYSLVISSAIFPAYYASVTDDQIHFGSATLSNSTLYAYAISLSYLLLTLISPALSGISDYSGRKMFFLKMFTYIGSVSCISLFFFKGMNEFAWGTACFMLATIGFSGSLVFYNSYLPLIASDQYLDKVSAKGFALGYTGSVILLVANLFLINNAASLGLEENALAVRISFVSVGFWWLFFAHYSFRRLPKDEKTLGFNPTIIRKGFIELRQVWHSIRDYPHTRRFLVAFFCYSAGVQTVMYLAATFAEKELKFATSELVLIILILQIVAIFGAHAFARLSAIKGNKFVLMFMLVIWICICVAAFFVVKKSQFYGIAASVGIVMGGIQSLSRSTYSKLLPEQLEDTASFFSFYDVLEKLAIVLGTFSFGFIEYVTHGIRNSVLVLIAYFVIGILILAGVRIKHMAKDAVHLPA